MGLFDSHLNNCTSVEWCSTATRQLFRRTLLYINTELKQLGLTGLALHVEWICFEGFKNLCFVDMIRNNFIKNGSCYLIAGKKLNGFSLSFPVICLFF